MYRVVQESLTNALRHADADTVTVSLMVDAETVTVYDRRRRQRHAAPGAG